jgi:cyclic-di-AMP phosphodiesterase PgpH
LKYLDKIQKYFKLPGNFDFRSDLRVKIAIGVITWIIIVFFLPSYKSIDTQYEIGTIWSNEDLIAPFTFPVYKDEMDYQAEMDEVISSVSPIFTDNKLEEADVKTQVGAFFNKLTVILQKASELESRGEGNINSEQLDEDKDDLFVEFSAEEWRTLYAYYKNELPGEHISFGRFREDLGLYLQQLSKNKILNINKTDVKSETISVTSPEERVLSSIQINNVLDKPQVESMVLQRFGSQLNNNELTSVVRKITNIFLKPTLVYDQKLTDLEIKTRIDQIPKTIGIVRENERIISKHDPITRQTKLKLDSYKKVRLERIGVQDYFVQFLGKMLMVLILLVSFVFFLRYIRPEVYEDNVMLILIASLVILQCFFAYISMQVGVNAPIELLIFVPVTSILLTIIFDSRLSFYSSAITCFLVAAVRGGDFTIAFISFCGAVLAIFSVRDVRNRNQIFRSFFFILIGNSISILAISLDRTQETGKILNHLLFGGINAIMSPVIAYGLLIFYERVFKITTDLTLVELSDFNHPLLKDLSSKAPGTFHHSIIMGNLCEKAADSIGANGVLARVGCYYHDIGKTVRPEYYVENQMDNNLHDRLNPKMSAKIIISHVKDGIKLAEKYKLPKEIVDFIPMHHGTLLVSYFHQKDKEAFETGQSEELYRYPGPKPKSKETGIVMLADAVEASTRAIDDPTPHKLEKQIDKIVQERLMDGQLDECDLTLKDLTKIKASFLSILVGIHHHRIKYPEGRKEEEEENVAI